MTRRPRRASAGLAGRVLSCVLMAVGGLAAAAPSSGEHYRVGGFDDRVDLLVRDGFDRPDAAIARIDALLAEQPDSNAGARRVAVQARGLIQAQAGQAGPAEASALELAELARAGGDPMAAAGAALVRALVAETAGALDVASSLAQPALRIYRAACPALAPADGPSLPADHPPCDYRAAWRAMHVLERRSLSLGQIVQARAEVGLALDLAESAADPWRKAYDRAALGYVRARGGDWAAADLLLGQARREATDVGDPVLMARVRSNEARVADTRGDHVAALRLTEEALALARRVPAERMQALLLGNLSDLYAKQQRPAQALRAAEAALRTVRRFNDQRAERVLINNAGLAKIGLRRIAEGKQDLARLIAMWRASDALADQAATLREFGQALADAGDARGALELFHRERAVTTEVVRRSREAALKEMQERDDARARLRDIELLNRDNALKSQTLANRTLLLKNWAVVAAMLALALVFVGAMVRRVRVAGQRLARTEARLREQSERDPLTHLANRRHLHAVMDAAAAGEPGQAFEGAMLLIDIDHFKAINDTWGHAAGDAVLVEFGRRLTRTVRDGDLVARWGGEEFLIVAAGLSAEQGHQLAARILEQINALPFELDGQPVRVTASIGYGRFPLADRAAPVPWQQGVNLVDIALYSAKREGRNRAMGIVAPADDAPPGLRRVPAEVGVRDGTGEVTFGPTRPMELIQTVG